MGHTVITTTEVDKPLNTYKSLYDHQPQIGDTFVTAKYYGVDPPKQLVLMMTGDSIGKPSQVILLETGEVFLNWGSEKVIPVKAITIEWEV